MAEQQAGQPATVSAHLTEGFHNALMAMCEAYGRSASVLANEGQQARQMVQQNDLVRQKMSEILTAKTQECESLKERVAALEVEIEALREDPEGLDELAGGEPEDFVRG